MKKSIYPLSFTSLNDSDEGIDLPYLSVTIADLPLYTDLFLAGVHRLDQFEVETVNKTSAHLSCPGQFVIIGIQKLIEQDEFMDFHDLRQLIIDLPDLFQDQFLDGRLLGKIHVGRIGDHLPLRPVSGISEIDVDHGRQIGTPLAENHRLFDERAEFQAGFDKIRRKSLSAFVADDLFFAADDQQMAVAVQISGIAGPEPTLQRPLRWPDNPGNTPERRRD